MTKEKTLEENIRWLLECYIIALREEINKEEPNEDVINDYDNIIIELRYALNISKGGE